MSEMSVCPSVCGKTKETSAKKFLYRKDHSLFIYFSDRKNG